MEDLVIGGVAVAVIAALGWLHRRRVEARYLAGERGDAVDVPVRLRGSGPPYPRRLRRGTLVPTPNGSIWQPRFGGAPILLPRTKVDRAGVRPTQAMQGDVRLFARDAGGTRFELAVGEAYAELARDLLQGDVRPAAGADPADPVAAPARRRPVVWWLAWAAVALGTAWVAGWIYLFTAGTPVRAQVVEREPDDYCRVVWDDGRPQDAWIDCTAEVGAHVDAVAMPWPFRGEAVDTAWPAWMAPGAVVALAGGVPLGVAGWRRRRAAGGPELAVTAPSSRPLDERADEPETELGPHEVRYSRIAAVVEAQQRSGEWPSPRPALADRIPAPVRAYAGPLAIACWPLFFALLLGLLGGGHWLSWLALRGATTTQATAEVVMVDPTFPLLPDEAVVTFRVAGRDVEARIATASGLDEGDRVTVGYLPDDPERARAADPRWDRLDAMAVRSAAGVGLLILTAAGLLVLRAGWARRVRRARRTPATPVRYALALDPTNRTAALLFAPEGDPAPLVAVPLVERVHGAIPAAGRAEVHGVPEDGSAVVLRVGDRLLWPAAPAELIDEVTVRELVNGTLVLGEADGEDEQPDPLERWR